MKLSFFDRKLAFKISLLLNFLCLLYGGHIVYKKKDEFIQLMINKFYFSQVTDSQLMEIHKRAYIISENIYGNENAKQLKILVLGNSISAGMAASDQERDYVHLLINDILASRNLKIKYKFADLVDFERYYKTFDYQSLQNLIDFDPEIVVFQLGENVNSSFNNIKDFIPYYVQLVSKFPSAKKIITTPFFPSKDKNEAALEVAIRTGARLVDLSHLTLIDARNYAHSERSYSNRGIGIHPGDRGMRNIERLIFCAINSI